MKFIGKTGIVCVCMYRNSLLKCQCLIETKAFLGLLNLAFLVHSKTKTPFFSLETIHESK